MRKFNAKRSAKPERRFRFIENFSANHQISFGSSKTSQDNVSADNGSNTPRFANSEDNDPSEEMKESLEKTQKVPQVL